MILDMMSTCVYCTKTDPVWRRDVKLVCKVAGTPVLKQGGKVKPRALMSVPAAVVKGVVTSIARAIHIGDVVADDMDDVVADDIVLSVSPKPKSKSARKLLPRTQSKKSLIDTHDDVACKIMQTLRRAPSRQPTKPTSSDSDDDCVLLSHIPRLNKSTQQKACDDTVAGSITLASPKARSESNDSDSDDKVLIFTPQASDDIALDNNKQTKTKKTIRKKPRKNALDIDADRVRRAKIISKKRNAERKTKALT